MMDDEGISLDGLVKSDDAIQKKMMIMSLLSYNSSNYDYRTSIRYE